MQGPLKPRVLGDVMPRGRADASARQWDAFGPARQMVFLPAARGSFFKRLSGMAELMRPSTLRAVKAAVLFCAAAALIFGSAVAPTALPRAAGDTGTAGTAADSAAERAQLQDQLQQLEAQMEQYEGQILSYKKQGSTLSGEISTLNAKIAKLNLQIQATNLTIAQLDREIADTQSHIVVTQNDIANKKAAIAGLMQNLYQNDQVSLIEVFLKNPHLSDFWSDAQNISLVQDNLRVTVQQVTDLQAQLTDQEQQFIASKQDAASAVAYQRQQAAEVSTTKGEKSDLLAQTKGQESKYQALLAQTRQTAAQIRNRIFQLLGGGELSFEDAYQYAKLAGGATGIEPAFILAILDHESALGQNVGQCNYQNAMRPSDKPLFLALTQSLNLDPNTMLVSCANRDGAYGGAMGPAQFIPSTWNLYAGNISSVTGHSPASPWNNADAFVATALYLRDGMTGCKVTYSSVTAQERCTAAKYYAGSRWRNYLWTYGEAVVERAQSFAGDIQTITS